MCLECIGIGCRSEYGGNWTLFRFKHRSIFANNCIHGKARKDDQNEAIKISSGGTKEGVGLRNYVLAVADKNDVVAVDSDELKSVCTIDQGFAE